MSSVWRYSRDRRELCLARIRLEAPSTSSPPSPRIRGIPASVCRGGTFDHLDADGHISGPLTDSLKARLSVRAEHTGDWQQSASRQASLGARRFTNARLLLDFDPADRLSLELNANGWIDRS